MAAPIIAVGTYCPFGIQKRDSAGNEYLGHMIPIEGNQVDDENTYYYYHVNDIVLDISGCVYIATDSLYDFDNNSRTTVKLDPYGNVIWYANHGAPLGGIAIDDDLNVYTYGHAVNDSFEQFDGEISGDRTGYYTTRKYNSSGILQWSADHGYRSETGALGGLLLSQYYPIVYKNGYIYTGSSQAYSTSIYKLKKIDASDGSLIWEALNSIDDHVYAIAVDDSDNVFVVGSLGTYPIGQNAYLLKKFDSDGVLLASATMPSGLNGYAVGFDIVIDSSDNLIIATFPITLDNTNYYNIRRYDSDCVYIDSPFADNHTIVELGIDDDDYVYLACDKPAGSVNPTTFLKIDSDFSSILWEYRLVYAGTSSYEGGLCIAVKDVEIPPLPVPLEFGVPTIIGDLYTAIPGLPLSVSLAVPALYREYIGRSLPNIYRAYLTGGTGTVEFIISSITIRRNVDGIYVDVIIPNASETAINQIESRTSGNIVIYKGIKFADESEQIDELISVPFSNFRYDGGSSSASITLSGSGEPETDHVSNRTLSGISYRNSTNGVRRIRCAVDTYLRVGDTANLGGGESIVVAEIVINISPDSAIMEVLEASA